MKILSKTNEIKKKNLKSFAKWKQKLKRKTKNINTPPKKIKNYRVFYMLHFTLNSHKIKWRLYTNRTVCCVL